MPSGCYRQSIIAKILLPRGGRKTNIIIGELMPRTLRKELINIDAGQE